MLGGFLKKYLIPIKKYKLTHYLVIFALHYIFFVSLFTQAGLGSRLEGVFRYALPGYLLLVIAGLLALKSIPNYNKYRVWFMLLVSMLIIMSLKAFLADIETWRIACGLIPYLMFSLIFVGSDERIWPQLNKVFIVHTIIAALIVFADMNRIEGVDRNLYYLDGSNLFLGKQLLYGFPFLLLTWKKQHLLGKIAAMMGISAYTLIAVIGQYRGMFISIAFYIFVSYVICVLWHGRIRHKLLQIVYICALIIMIIGIGLLLSSDSLGLLPENISTTITSSFTEMLHRSDKTITTGVMSWQKEGRWVELTKEVLPQITPTEWMIGRGVAFDYEYLTTNINSHRTMVHITFGHLVMQGGLLLLLTILLGPILAGLKSYKRKRDMVTLATATILIHFLLMFMVCANPKNNLTFVLICLCTGHCFYKNEMHRRLRIKNKLSKIAEHAIVRRDAK